MQKLPLSNLCLEALVLPIKEEFVENQLNNRSDANHCHVSALFVFTKALNKLEFSRQKEKEKLKYNQFSRSFDIQFLLLLRKHLEVQTKIAENKWKLN